MLPRWCCNRKHNLTGVKAIATCSCLLEINYNSISGLIRCESPLSSAFPCCVLQSSLYTHTGYKLACTCIGDRITFREPTADISICQNLCHAFPCCQSDASCLRRLDWGVRACTDRVQSVSSFLTLPRECGSIDKLTCPSGRWCVAGVSKYMVEQYRFIPGRARLCVITL